MFWQDNHCIYFDVKFAKVITVLRSAADLVYIIHMLLQVINEFCMLYRYFILVVYLNRNGLSFPPRPHLPLCLQLI